MSRITVIMNLDNNEPIDIEIPADAAADALLLALNKTFRPDKRGAVALRSVNPLAYLCGNTRVDDVRLHDGSELFFVED